jgi:hypothetical protein
MISQFAKGQKICISILDSITQKPLAKATVVIDTTVFVCNDSGSVCFEARTTKIKASHIGYADKWVVLSEPYINQVVSLLPSYNFLEEMSISNVPVESYEVFTSKQQKVSIAIQPNQEIAAEVPNTAFGKQTVCLKTILLMLNNTCKQGTNSVTINVYESIDGQPGLKKNKQPIVIDFDNSFSNKIIEIPVYETILLDKGKYFICVTSNQPKPCSLSFNFYFPKKVKASYYKLNEHWVLFDAREYYFKEAAFYEQMKKKNAPALCVGFKAIPCLP